MIGQSNLATAKSCLLVYCFVSKSLVAAVACFIRLGSETEDLLAIEDQGNDNMTNNKDCTLNR